MAEMTLEQLKAMNPEKLQIEDPNLERDWESHLLWLMDNQPAWTKQTFQVQRKTLEAELLRVTKVAALKRAIMTMEGKLYPDQIEEVINHLLAPPDGPAIMNENLEPMPEKIRSLILAWSQNLHDPEMKL